MKASLLLIVYILLELGSVSLELNYISLHFQQDSTQVDEATEQVSEENSSSNLILKIVSVLIGIIGSVILVFAFISQPINPLLVIIGVVYIGCGITAWILLSWIPIIVALAVAFILLKLK